jgi:hypothetical protein
MTFSEDLVTVESRLKDDLQYLSSDELAGRDVGTEGIAKAGEFIAQRFAHLGLETDKFNGGPFQEFKIPGPVEVGRPENNRLTFAGVENLPELKFQSDFSPLTLGRSGKFDAEVVFVGFGITAPEYQYDDYEGVDVEGKVVIALRKEPQQSDPNSKFNGKENSAYAFFTSKELNASLHKVAALILVNDRQTVESEGGDKLLGATEAGRASSQSKVPTLFCSRNVIDTLLQKAAGKSLDQLQAEIDESGKPRSMVLSGVTARGEVDVEAIEIVARNVVGFLPGRGELAKEYVVVGAHYDHVGMGGPGSLAPGTIEVHNGADDNGSGTTALLEVARRISSAEGVAPRRGIIFIAFSGEEKGLLGSKYYVRNARWPLEQTVAMVNMDMVGRLRENNLTIFGTGTAVGFDALVERINESTNFLLDKQAAGFGPSDHSSFYEASIPVFHFFTGLHNDYHRPSDDLEWINLEGMARISNFVTDLVIEIASRPERPKLLKNSAVADVGRTGQQRARVTLGIQMRQDVETVVVESVYPESGAANAGIKPGDTIVQIAAFPVPTVRELRRVMGQRKPGETTEVVILRDGAEVKLQVTLGSN